MKLKQLGAILALLPLIACTEKPADDLQSNATEEPTQTSSVDPTNPHDLKALAQELQKTGHTVADEPVAKPIKTDDGRVRVDWSLIDTKVKPINPNSYDYPFAEDSQPVQNYAKAYNITPKQAQHAMMLSMASPEALGKILDQLSDYYISHEVIDGHPATLVIHTKAGVVSEQHDYVFADKFGEGLVLPIEIRPKTE